IVVERHQPARRSGDGLVQRVAAPGERAHRGPAAPAHVALAAWIDRPDQHAAVDQATGALAGAHHAANPGGTVDLHRVERDLDVVDPAGGAAPRPAGGAVGVPTPRLAALDAHQGRLPRAGGGGGSGAEPIAVDSLDSPPSCIT